MSELFICTNKTVGAQFEHCACTHPDARTCLPVDIQKGVREMSKFYRFTAQDFEKVPFDQIRRGDKIAWPGPQNLYGSVPIDWITAVEGGYAVEVMLPVGAQISSNDTCVIRVEWEGEKPVIHVVLYYWHDNGGTSPKLIQRG